MILESKARDKNLRLDTRFENILEGESPRPGKASPMINSDGQRVQQVLLCLVSNALKFTKRGGITISIRVVRELDDQFLKVAVTDTGVGIPACDQNKLFKLFGFIQNKNSVMNTNGIGLGLVIAKNIVKRFKGQISMTSIPAPEPGHGSTFTFTFLITPKKA